MCLRTRWHFCIAPAKILSDTHFRCTPAAKNIRYFLYGTSMECDAASLFLRAWHQFYACLTIVAVILPACCFHLQQISFLVAAFLLHGRWLAGVFQISWGSCLSALYTRSVFMTLRNPMLSLRNSNQFLTASLELNVNSVVSMSNNNFEVSYFLGKC